MALTNIADRLSYPYIIRIGEKNILFLWSVFGWKSSCFEEFNYVILDLDNLSFYMGVIMDKWLILFFISIVVETGLFIFLLINHRKMAHQRPEAAIEVELEWEEANTRLFEMIYLIAVFIPMIIIALVIGKNPDTTIRDLILTCIVSCYAFGLSLLSKGKYFFTDKGIFKTKVEKKEFVVKPVFLWHELKEIQQSRHGFKFFLKEGLDAQEGEKQKRMLSGFVPVGKDSVEIIAKIAAKGVAIKTK